MQIPMVALPEAAFSAPDSAGAEEAGAVEDADDAVELESPPPQAVRAAVAPTTAEAFRKSRREIIFIIAFSFRKSRREIIFIIAFSFTEYKLDNVPALHTLKGQTLSNTYYTFVSKRCAIVKVDNFAAKVLDTFYRKSYKKRRF